MPAPPLGDEAARESGRERPQPQGTWPSVGLHGTSESGASVLTRDLFPLGARSGHGSPEPRRWGSAVSREGREGILDELSTGRQSAQRLQALEVRLLDVPPARSPRLGVLDSLRALSEGAVSLALRTAGTATAQGRRPAACPAPPCAGP